LETDIKESPVNPREVENGKFIFLYVVYMFWSLWSTPLFVYGHGWMSHQYVYTKNMKLDLLK